MFNDLSTFLRLRLQMFYMQEATSLNPNTLQCFVLFLDLVISLYLFGKVISIL